MIRPTARLIKIHVDKRCYDRKEVQADELRRWHVLPLVPELLMRKPGRAEAASLMSTNTRDTNPGCPRAELHTPAPSGYVAWHEWAAVEQRAREMAQHEPGFGGNVAEYILDGGPARYRQHPETGMVQRVHADGSHHLPSFNPRCADGSCR